MRLCDCPKQLEYVLDSISKRKTKVRLATNRYGPAYINKDTIYVYSYERTDVFHLIDWSAVSYLYGMKLHTIRCFECFGIVISAKELAELCSLQKYSNSVTEDFFNYFLNKFPEIPLIDGMERMVEYSLYPRISPPR